jgi:elongation factor Ts
MVKELREKTGAGMMDCKKALAESQGDMEKAVEHLRKQGIASAAKKASRLASEGLVEIRADGGAVAVLEVNCETDFVAKTEDFQNFVRKLGEHILKHRPRSVEDLLAQKWAGGDKTVDLVTKELIGKIGENVGVRRFALLGLAGGEQSGHYLHMGSKIGAVVKVKGDPAKVGSEILKDLAMHVAAASPRYVRPTEISQEERAKEKEIYLAQLKDSGKPPEILEKIVEGKLAKFGAEICLEEQIFIKDPAGKKPVKQFLSEKDSGARIVEFIRYQVGEGLAKKEEDFAAEVAKQLGK